MLAVQDKTLNNNRFRVGRYEPEYAIQHGRNPILTLTCDVRDATDREAHDLAHRDDEHDEVVAA